MEVPRETQPVRPRATHGPQPGRRFNSVTHQELVRGTYELDAACGRTRHGTLIDLSVASRNSVVATYLPPSPELVRCTPRGRHWTESTRTEHSALTRTLYSRLRAPLAPKSISGPRNILVKIRIQRGVEKIVRALTPKREITWIGLIGATSTFPEKFNRLLNTLGQHNALSCRR